MTEICTVLVLAVLPLMLPKISASENIKLMRALSGAGFHRNLETTISLPKNLRLQPFTTNCSLMLFETLPPGIYADPFQVLSLATFGGPQVLFDRAVNIEAPEYLSQPHELLIYLDLGNGKVREQWDGQLRVMLPVHARYHKPAKNSEMSHSVVNILPPGLYSSCSDDQAEQIIAPCNVRNSSVCTWSHLSYTSESPVVQLQLPVGQHKDFLLVVVTTLLTTVVVAAVLIKDVWVPR